MTRIGPILVLLPVACVAQVHNFQFPRMGGSYYASSFANWTASTQTPVMAPGLATVQITPAKVTLVANDQIQPVAVGVPVLVQAGGASETVTPVAVNCTPQACAMTATFADAHPGGFNITSASDGLDEAIEVAAAQGGGTVVVGSDWSGTTAQITGASGASGVAVLDSRGGAHVRYTWTGSAYQAALAVSASGAFQASNVEQVLFADQYPGDGWATKLQAAIAALGPAGGTISLSGLDGAQTELTPGDLDLSAPNVSVRFGPGNYTINGNIVVTGANVQLLCDPNSTLTLVDDGSAASHILQFNGNGETITGCTVTQSNVTGRSGVYGTLSSFAATNLTIRHVAVTGGSSTGIFISGSVGETTLPSVNSGLQMSDVTVSGTEADGIMLTRGVANAELAGIHASGTGDDGLSMISIITDDGTHNYLPNSNISLTGAVLSGNGIGPAGRGLTILGGHDIAVSNVVISSPINQGLAIEAQPGSVSGNSTYYPYHIIANNVSVSNSGSGASATLGCGGVISDARDITLNGFTSRVTTRPVGSDADGLCVLGAAKDILVNGFQSSQAAGAGIALIQTSSAEARILQELWTNLGDTAPASAGISNVSINGAVIRNAAGAGISVRGQSTLHVTGITIENAQVYNVASGQYGVSLAFADSSAVVGGEIAGGVTKGSVTINSGTGDLVSASRLVSPTDGVDVVGCTACRVVDNDLLGGSGIGIAVDPTGADNFISGNSVEGFATNTTLAQDGTSVVWFNNGDTSPIIVPNHLTASITLTGTPVFPGNYSTGGNTITQPAAAGTLALVSQLPLSGSVAASTSSLAASSCGDSVAATITGATTGMLAAASGAGALPSPGLTLQAAVTAANTVTVEYCNLTTAAIVPAALTINVRVVQ